ncbi:MAG: type II toxin-antitoxin system PemK/MazF family toxin [Cyanobacteria bacterium K_DeepCast_35m_m2_023]|nr:type II toxin-antitoxin system PemK/MazF family toxin [Cyanobacteria bacterium K_DeepCast_35m_m2_023]
MAERGRIYCWPRDRDLGDSKTRPVLVIAPDAATSCSNRWVVVPISSDPRLASQPLAVALPANPDTGLKQQSYAMAWQPTTVLRQQLDGPLGRIGPEPLRKVLRALATALDLSMLEPWLE